MIISRTQVQNLLSVYDKNIIANQNARTGRVQAVRKSDEVDISVASKIKLKTFRGMSEADPAREERITELREQISMGIYRIDGDQIAEKMIQRAIIDELA